MNKYFTLVLLVAICVPGCRSLVRKPEDQPPDSPSRNRTVTFLKPGTERPIHEIVQPLMGANATASPLSGVSNLSGQGRT
jgi:hypothetical protein